MKWTPNNLIALVAVSGTLISPILTAIFKWLQLKNDKADREKEQKLQAKQETFHDLQTKYRDVFENYIKQSEKEINQKPFNSFSSQQQELQALVYLYADDPLIEAIKKLDSDSRDLNKQSELQKDILKVARAFNSQWQKLTPLENS